MNDYIDANSAVQAIRATYDNSLVQANSIADEAVQRFPECAEIHALRASILLWRGNDDEARAALDQAAKLGPDLAVTWAAKADVESILGDPTECEAAANRALELDSADQWVLCRCLSAYNAVQSESTTTTARRLVELYPDSDQATASLISVLNLVGQSDDAIQLLAEAEVRFPGSPAIMGARAKALFNDGCVNDAIILLYAATEKMPESSALWSHLSMMLFQTGRLEEAENAAKRALEISGRCDAALLVMANICSFRGLHWQAAEWINKARSAMACVGGMDDLRNAMKALKAGNCMVAIQIIDDALPSLRPTVRDACLEVKAKALLHMGKFDEAMAVVEQMTGNGSSPGAIYILKGNILYKRGSLEAAVNVLREGDNKYPEVGDVRAAFFWLLHAQGETQEVRSLILKTISNPPQTPNAYLPIIRALMDAGYKEDARQLANEGCRRHPAFARQFNGAAWGGIVDQFINKVKRVLEIVRGR